MFFKKKNDDNSNLSETTANFAQHSPLSDHHSNQHNTHSHKVFNHNKIDSSDLLRDYENIKLLAMNPQYKAEIQNLITEARNDIQKIWRLINQTKKSN